MCRYFRIERFLAPGCEKIFFHDRAHHLHRNTLGSGTRSISLKFGFFTECLAAGWGATGDHKCFRGHFW